MNGLKSIISQNPRFKPYKGKSKSEDDGKVTKYSRVSNPIRESQNGESVAESSRAYEFQTL